MYLFQDTKQKTAPGPGPLQLGSDTDQKKKGTPGTLRPGSNTKQEKKREHLAQKDVKQPNFRWAPPDGEETKKV